jgi:predicted RND superfamily exporter protein
MRRVNQWMFLGTQLCVHHPRTVVILTLLVTLILGIFARDVKRDHSAEGMLPPDEPIRDYYNEFKQHFNIRDRIAIALYHEQGVLTPEVLAQVKRVSDWLEDGGIMDEVTSLSTVENITAGNGEIFTGPLMEQVPRTPKDVEPIRRALEENPLIAKALVSRDGRATLIIAQPVFDMWETDRCVTALNALQEMFAQDPGPARFHLAGYPMIIALADQSMDRDNRLMLPILLAVVVVLLWLAFHSLRGVWIPLAVVVAATVWTFGAMRLLDMEITVIASSIPIVLVAMGIADGIHVIHEYYHHLRLGKGNVEAITCGSARGTWRRFSIPCRR